MANSPEKKKELALREKQRRERDKQWLASLPEEERNKILEERRAADRARRAKFKATLSAEEIAERKAKDAAYDAAKYQKEKERVALLPEEEQKALEEQKRARRQQQYAIHGEKYNQRRRDKIASLSLEEKAEFDRANRAYYAQYSEKNREAIREKNRIRQQERGHIYEANQKARFLALPVEEQTAIKEASRAYLKEYYETNKERILVQKKEYYELNRDTILTNKKQYYLENAEERRAYHRNYYKTNAAEMNRKGREWYQLNKEKALEARRQYKLKYPDRVRACEKACEHNRRNAPGKLTSEDIRSAVEESEGICPYCLKRLVFGEIHIDHKHPLSRGGWNSRDNIVACCAECNLKKHDKTVREFVFGLSYEEDE